MHSTADGATDRGRPISVAEVGAAMTPASPQPVSTAARAAPSVIRVLVVDDSAFMRKAISDMISSDPALAVVGNARNGQEAIDLAKSLSPDVITKCR
jgi:PleD family two-component response regulator